MAHMGWLCLAGTEVVNNDRVATYAAAGWRPGSAEVARCSTCGPELAVALEQPGGAYVDPVTDDAPWYSPTEPHSGDFGGFLVLSIDGLGSGDYTRSLTQRASGRGSFLGRGAQASPVITVNGVLLGKTCCSLEYGFRWLKNVLRGECAENCAGDELTFLDCCPTWTGDPVADIEPHLRNLQGVALVRSPTITGRYKSSAGCGGGNASCSGGSLIQVSFQLAASQPCVFRPPVLLESGVAFNIANPSPCVEWVLQPPGTACTDDECAETTDCLADPGCPPPPKPPTPPAPVNPCVCDPMSTVRACIDIPADSIPEFAEGVPVVEISSGSAPLRQVRMRFWPNPLGLPADELDPCTACGEVTLSRIPAYSTFRMDGLDNTVVIDCPGNAVTDAGPLLGVAGGRLPFAFPEIACGGVPYLLCVEADAETAAADASIAVSVAVREC